MPFRNDQLADIFYAMATLLASRRANPYRVRAYRRAAEAMASMNEDIAGVGREKLEEIPGIGRELADKILEFVATGTIRAYEELKAPLPQEVAGWAALPGLSESIVSYLYYRLGIRTPTDLETLIRSHLIRTMPGFTGTEEALLEALAAHQRAADSTPAPGT